MPRLRNPERGRMKASPHYNRWYDMIRRCYNPDCPTYQHYGGRGITVCKKWREDFWSFHDYLEGLEGYEKGSTMDRINNDGPYEDGNIRWAPRGKQMRNRRNWGGDSQRGVYKQTGSQNYCVMFTVGGKQRYFGTYPYEVAKKVAAFAERLIQNSLDG